ncbi:MAG: hypothetical protein GKR87_11360 [Kiritimatiellae bacterium]|nr:hypothetical protein [Kiritimatiellia bacterium]
MKTTINIDGHIMSQLKQEAARQGKTMSELFETALRLMFQNKKSEEKLSPLPTFHGGNIKKNISNRDTLYEAMEQE